MSFVLRNIYNHFVDDLFIRPQKQIPDDYEFQHYPKYTTQTHEKELTIYYQNCWGVPVASKDTKERMLKLMDIIKAEEYDLIVFIELWSQNFREQLIHTAESTSYNHFSFAGGTGMPIWPYVNGTGIVVFSKFEMVDCKYHLYTVNGKPHMIQHADYFGGKGVGYCEISTGFSKIDLFVTHIHASYTFDHKDYLSTRLAQTIEFCDFVKQNMHNELCILVGDFNTQEGEVPYKILHSSFPNMIDTWLKVNGTEHDYLSMCTYNGIGSTYLNDQPQRLDYLFCMKKEGSEEKEEWQPTDCQMVKFMTKQGHSVSDHFGLYGRFSYDKVMMSNPDDCQKNYLEKDHEEAMRETRNIIQNGIVALKKERKWNYKKGYLSYLFTVIVILFFHQNLSKSSLFLLLMIPIYSMYELFYTKIVLSDNIRNFQENVNEISIQYPDSYSFDKVEMV